MTQLLIAQLIVILGGCILGGYVFLRPRKIIDLQIRFYALINWKVSPISMDKEIRNTKMMGFIVILFALCSSILILYGR